MGLLVTQGALLQCPFGVAPAPLSVLPTNFTMAANMPAATIMDNVPMLNVPSFGMCTSLANPTVAAATAAALGVLVPMPCLPVLPAPWFPGSPTVMISNKPALNNASKCQCAYGGTISIITPGEFTVNVP
ncbi:MAG: hypothetical protein JWM12_819 [Ilumatobacteraceae bacterium]|nr:hypothetical protein [Ilumatobacteraceae bacterium]